MQKNHNSTAYREALKQQSLIVAMSLFKRNGVKSVKMDDIATEMGISKRTLYELYSNKEDLLYECVRNDKQHFLEHLIEYAKTAANEMDILTHFFKCQVDDLGNTNPVFYTDIIKYEKTVEYLKRNKIKMKKNSQSFIDRGIEHGYFCNDVNYVILDRLADAAMNHAMQSRLYRLYSLRDIFRTFMIIFMRTCCTEKGQRYMLQLLDDEG